MDIVQPENTVKPSRPLNQNRRQGNRHRLHIPATLLLEGEPEMEINVTVTEMSVAGIGFRSRQALNVGTTYRVSSFDTLIPSSTKALIVSQRELPDGEFECGAKMV